MNDQAEYRIVCPIDLSAHSDAVLAYARLLAEGLHARLTVVHAERFEAPALFTQAQVDSLARELRDLKSDAVNELRRYASPRLGSVAADYAVVEDAPVTAILEAAEGADMVVMGTAGLSGVKRFLIGSVAEEVAREARIPVLAVRETGPAGGPAPRISRILIPVNFSEGSGEALKTAAMLASAFGAELLVTHIVESDDADEAAAQDRLCEWIPVQVRGACDYEVVVRRGAAADQIVQIARNEKADLIVLAAIHRPFLETTIIGSTSERVLRHAPCPVLAVPSRA